MECQCGAYVSFATDTCPACGRSISNPGGTPIEPINPVDTPRFSPWATNRGRSFSGSNASVTQPILGPAWSVAEKIVIEARQVMERKLRHSQPLSVLVLPLGKRRKTKDGWIVIGYLDALHYRGQHLYAVLWKSTERCVRTIRKDGEL